MPAPTLFNGVDADVHGAVAIYGCLKVRLNAKRFDPFKTRSEICLCSLMAKLLTIEGVYVSETTLDVGSNPTIDTTPMKQVLC